RLVHGISPLRTLSIAGLYPRRQRSANSDQLMFKPLDLPQSVASAITELRQSTTVPKASKTHAFTLANSGFTVIEPNVCSRNRSAGSAENEPITAFVMTLALPTTNSVRRSNLRLIAKYLLLRDRWRCEYNAKKKQSIQKS